MLFYLHQIAFLLQQKNFVSIKNILDVCYNGLGSKKFLQRKYIIFHFGWKGLFSLIIQNRRFPCD